MPRVSAFFGVVIWMYPYDHAPPHFHATYSGHEVLVRLDTLEILRGDLPRRAMALVFEWATGHRHELWANWRKAELGDPLEPIQPLE